MSDGPAVVGAISRMSQRRGMDSESGEDSGQSGYGIGFQSLTVAVL